MVVFYVSGHGFGHASRDLAVLHALLRQRPTVKPILRTGVPAWLFQRATRQPLEIQPLETDSGLAQVDSLTIDERETARRAVRFYENFDERVAAEAAWLRSVAAQVVVADVPPLACAAAARAEIPSVVLANFTWDWVYEALEHFTRDAGAVLPVITRAYASATHALRLPMHGGFAPMAAVIRDIPFVARRSERGRAATRAALGLDERQPIALASFGGHGVRMPYVEAAREGRMLILLTEFEAEANGGAIAHPHIRCVSAREMTERHLRYEDLVAAADVVVSKPGYGIVSECIANGTALLYTSRGRMVEYDVLVAQMPRALRCRFISQGDLLDGRWADAIDSLLAQPPAPTRPMTNGADVAAHFILALTR
ncbi:MAG: hypothetical protein AB7N65_04820 [Vicinamibacterales bacterium]